MPSSAMLPGELARRKAAIVGSARWAAWADALGFPTELARDASDVSRRTGTKRVGTTEAWRRRIGGRRGVEVDLPAGMYSDDTQIRLAVSRSIRAPDRFDTEAFSKVELPVLLSYGFGVGRGTRAAAQSLTKRSVRWYSNFYDARGVAYVNAGGNGAAMRIQPHVWATAALDNHTQFLRNVVRDAVITHGHIRGILGAALHASALAVAITEGAPPEPSRWKALARSLMQLAAVVRADDVLSERWLPPWEKESRCSLDDALAEGIDELSQMVDAAERAAALNHPVEARYAELADSLGARVAATRGSGTITAVLALWLAHCGASDPVAALRGAVNLIGSDTDTVATMAGALIGVSAPDELPGPLMDEALISREAERLALIALGEEAPSFPHPDPLSWQPPKTQLDALGRLGDRVVLAGLGPLQKRSEPLSALDGTLWQWFEMDIGQTVLVKRRAELPELPAHAAPQERGRSVDTAIDATLIPEQQLLLEPPNDSARSLADVEHARRPDAAGRRPRASRDALSYPDDPRAGVDLVVKSRFESLLMSRLLLHYAAKPDGSMRAAVFAALLADELRARDRRQDRM